MIIGSCVSLKGMEPKGLNPFTVKVMQEVGIDVSKRQSKSVENYLGKTLFRDLVTVCDDADQNCPTVWLGVNTRTHWSFEDPVNSKALRRKNLQSSVKYGI